MVHTNFEIDPEIATTFSQEKSKMFALMIQIDDERERVQLTKVIEPVSSKWDDNFNNLRQQLPEDLSKAASYFIVNLESYMSDKFDMSAPEQQKWLLLSYVGPRSSVRQRMLYSGSLQLLRDTVGNSNIVGTHQLTDPQEFDANRFDYEPRSQRHVNAQSFMTDREREVELEKESMSSVVTTSNLKGIELPKEDEVDQLINQINQQLKDSSSTPQVYFATLMIDQETVRLDQSKKEKIEPGSIGSLLPSNEPRFIMYFYPHEHDGETYKSSFFIYYCPQKSPVKKRMIYSSSKQPLLSSFEQSFEHNLEVTDIDDLLSDEYLLDYAHPKKVEEERIIKPKRPGRGRRRVATE